MTQLSCAPVAGAPRAARGGCGLRGGVLALLTLAFSLRAGGADADVLVVLSDASSGYETVAGEFRSGVQQRHPDVRIDTTAATRLDAIEPGAFDAYDLVVTVGLSAAQATLARAGGAGGPAPRVLCTLIPRQSFERLERGRARALSALYIDQPLGRELDLLRLALPGRRRVGAILGPTSRLLEDELVEAAQARALSLASARIVESSGLFAAMQEVVPHSDVLLLLADPVVANPDTVYGLLLTTYRAQLPVLGFSAGLGNAGALLSLFSTAAQQGRQAAEIAADAMARGGALPPPQYPKYFTVAVNASVAHSLGLRVPAAAALEAALAAPGNTAPAPGAARIEP